MAIVPVHNMEVVIVGIKKTRLFDVDFSYMQRRMKEIGQAIERVGQPFWITELTPYPDQNTDDISSLSDESKGIVEEALREAGADYGYVVTKDGYVKDVGSDTERCDIFVQPFNLVPLEK